MKPVFDNVASLIGGLLEDELKKKKKSKRSYAQSKYPKFKFQAPPAPARFPFMLPPPAPAGVRLGRPPGRRRRDPYELAREAAMAVGFAYDESVAAQEEAEAVVREAVAAYDKAVKDGAPQRAKRALASKVQSARGKAKQRALDVEAANADVEEADGNMEMERAAAEVLAEVRGARIGPRAADAAAEEAAAEVLVTPAKKAPRKKRGKKSPEVLFPEDAAADEGADILGMGRFLGHFR
jgi:hypothetical protein